MACLLTAASGAVDVLTWARLGNVFSSAMTGNLALFGIAAGHPEPQLLGYVATAFVAYSVGAIIAGAVCGGELDGTAVWPFRATVAMGIEVVVLVVLLILGLLTPVPHGAVQLVMLTLCAGAMGLQSGAYRALKIPGILGSTYLSGNVVVLMAAIGRRQRDASGLISLLAIAVGAVINTIFVFHAPRLSYVFPLALVVVVIVMALRPQFRTAAAEPAPTKS